MLFVRHPKTDEASAMIEPIPNDSPKILSFKLTGTLQGTSKNPYL